MTQHICSKGSIIAEAALMIPILLGITFVVIEFGNVLYLSNTLNQIARTAVRYASVTPAYSQESLINESGANSLLPDIAKFSLNITPAPGEQKNVGTNITVTVQYNYTPIVNPFGLFNSDQPWAPTIMGAAIARSEVSYAQ